ncbi:MAG: hypothetical protein DMF98_22155 [Acidobacteria bacterium]|nr:MAG: hypothetical protein DMF98_22155 [Acidobacteriota bacterium]
MLRLYSKRNRDRANAQKVGIEPIRAVGIGTPRAVDELCRGELHKRLRVRAVTECCKPRREVSLGITSERAVFTVGIRC